MKVQVCRLFSSKAIYDSNVIEIRNVVKVKAEKK